LVAGKPPDHGQDEASALASHQFRTWLLSTVYGGSPIANPSPVEHGSIIWSCYTVRKRLRVVSGALLTHAAASITPASDPNDFQIPSTPSAGLIASHSILASSSSIQQNEPQDYFGSTAPTASDRDSTPPPPPPPPPPHPPPATARQARNNSALSSPRHVSGIPENATDTSLPSAEDSASLTNECVLRAQCAGNVDAFHSEPNASQDHDMGFFDWTRLPLTSSLPRHVQFARSIDWSLTPLGPIEYWSNDLRAMCNLIM
jgi:hypothetical protein